MRRGRGKATEGNRHRERGARETGGGERGGEESEREGKLKGENRRRMGDEEGERGKMGRRGTKERVEGCNR